MSVTFNANRNAALVKHQVVVESEAQTNNDPVTSYSSEKSGDQSGSSGQNGSNSQNREKVNYFSQGLETPWSEASPPPKIHPATSIVDTQRHHDDVNNVTTTTNTFADGSKVETIREHDKGVTRVNTTLVNGDFERTVTRTDSQTGIQTTTSISADGTQSTTYEPVGGGFSALNDRIFSAVATGLDSTLVNSDAVSEVASDVVSHTANFIPQVEPKTHSHVDVSATSTASDPLVEEVSAAVGQYELFKTDANSSTDVEISGEQPLDEALADTLELVKLIAPDAEPSEQLELAQSHIRLEEALAQFRVDGEKEPVVAQITETNALLRSVAGIKVLPTNRGKVMFTYTSETLPSALEGQARHYRHNDHEYGHTTWRMTRHLDQLSNSLIRTYGNSVVDVVNALATRELSRQYDEVRGFEFDSQTEAALLGLESTLFSDNTIDPSELATSIAALATLNASDTTQAMARSNAGELQFNIESFIKAGAELSHDPHQNAWVSAEQLSTDDLTAIADSVRIQTLEANLSDRGTEQYEEMQRAIAALDTTRTPEENRQLAIIGLKLDRGIALASNELPNDLVVTFTESQDRFREAGIAISMSSHNNGSLYKQYTTATLPDNLVTRYLHHRLDNDKIRYGDDGWYVNVPLARLSAANLIPLAKIQLELLPATASRSSLDQLNQFDGYSRAHDAEFQALIDQAAPVDPAQLPSDTPALADLLREYDTVSDAAIGSENDRRYEALAHTSYDVASSILTDDYQHLSEDQLKELYAWVNGETLADLGYESAYEIQHSNDEREIISHGPGGNFGIAKRDFALAWLGSTKQERIEYLGISAERWYPAEMYIGSGLQSEQIAKDIRKAEFGFDDIVKIGIAIGFSVATGNAASAWVTNTLSAGAGGAAALAGTTGAVTAASTTTSFLAAAAGGAVGSFTSTLILTEGDIEAALRSGAMAALTGGLADYAESLTGGVGLIAESIVAGAASELSGGEFLDGVLETVGEAFGVDVAQRLAGRMPAFVADLSGKAVEIAVRTGGDMELIQQELEEYAVDYAEGRVSTTLTSTVGAEFPAVANSLGGLAREVITSGGDMSKIRQYLLSEGFAQAFANDIGQKVIDGFGGRENFAAVMAGKITTLLIASRGDMSLVESGLENIALNVIGDWAERRVTTIMGGSISAEERPMANAIGSLVNVAISSGWDDNAISVFMHGPLVEALGQAGANAIPERFGGPEGFLASALEELTASYSASGGDMDLVADHMTYFLFGELVEAVQDYHNHGPLTLGSTGERVTELQDRLQQLGYLQSPSSGTFDTQTLQAVTNFQNDQIIFIDNSLETETNITLRSFLNDQLDALVLERDAQEYGVMTAVLIDQPYEVGEIPASFTPDQTELTSFVHPGEINQASDSQSITQLQNRLNELFLALNKPEFNTGPVDGTWGEGTASGLEEFQRYQLRLFDNIVETISDSHPNEAQVVSEIRDRLFNEMMVDTADFNTGVLLTEPLTDTSAYQLAVSFDAPLTNDQALAYLQSIGEDTPADGLVEAGFWDAWPIFRSTRRKALSKIRNWMQNVDDADIREAVEKLSSRELNNIGKALDDLSVSELDDFVGHIAPALSADNLAQVFKQASPQTREALVDAAHNSNDGEVVLAFADLAHRDMLEADTVFGRNLSRADKELLLDVGQLTLDIVGIFDPTPASDGSNVLISLARGDLFGAGLSAISIVPFVGDLAKVGKLGKWAQTVEAAIERMNDAHLAPVVRPYLEMISNKIDAAQSAVGSRVWNTLPANVRESLEGIRSKIDDALTRVTGSVTRTYGRNNVTWVQDANGNTIRATAVLRDVFPRSTHPRSPAESALARNVGQSGQPSDAGGHIIGHQFLGADSGRFNIVPQHGAGRSPVDSPNLNQGAYKTMENELADWISHKMEVRLDVQVLDYVDGRPSSFGVTYEVFDPRTGKQMYDNTDRFVNGPGQEFSRFKRDDMQARINEVNSSI